jgi:hypothetical protein
MQRHSSVRSIDPLVDIASIKKSNQDGFAAETPISATRTRMSKVMKRLKNPNWRKRRSRTASEALSEGQSISFSESGSSTSSSFIEGSSHLAFDDHHPHDRCCMEDCQQESNDAETCGALVVYEASMPTMTTIASNSTRLSTTRSTISLKGDLAHWCKSRLPSFIRPTMSLPDSFQNINHSFIK